MTGPRWLQEFKTFLVRGNLIELAVAFVMGVAFAALVTAFVTDWITPIIGAIFGGEGAFGDLSFTLHKSVFHYGHFFDALLSFVAIAVAVFFLVVKPVTTFGHGVGAATSPKSSHRPTSSS
jgi:large conductance mechanosensitive channel